VTVRVEVATLMALAQDPSIARLSLDAPLERLSANGIPGGPNQTLTEVLLNTLGIFDRSVTGADVGVAIVDSGFNPAAPGDFRPDRDVFYDFTSKASPDPSSPDDDFGHGTHVTGLVASDGEASSGQFGGLAPGAHLILLKVLDQNGQGYCSSVINALSFVVAHKADLRVDVVNLSLGHPIYEPARSDPMVQAVEQAVRAGIVVVVAAGNNGGDPTTHKPAYDGINSPANSPSAISAGALDTRGTVTRSDDTIPWYSSRGPTWYDAFQKPDLVAPGHHLVSDIDRTGTLYAAYPQLVVSASGPGAGPNANPNANPNGVTAASANYFRMSGTSMASAVTTGAVALVIKASRQAFGRSLPPNAVKAILEYTAIPLPGYDTLTQGAGAVNVAGAISLARSLDPAAAPGSWWLRTGVTPSTTIGGQTLAWSQRIIWDDQFLNGDEIYTNWAGWASPMAWGSHQVSDNRLVWDDGTSTVWAPAIRTVWTQSVVWGPGHIGYLDGDRIVWDDTAGVATVDSKRLVWDDLSRMTLTALTTPWDPYGLATLHGIETGAHDVWRPGDRHRVGAGHKR
jgi:serine protease AprX